MFKGIIKLIVIGALFISLLGGTVGQEPFKVEAATKLPDNHEIVEVKVEWDAKHHMYLIHVEERVGTLVVRIDQPQTETNVQWRNWAISGTLGWSLAMSDTREPKSWGDAPFLFDSVTEYYNDGNPKYENHLRIGLQKFGDFSNPNYYVGAAIYLPKKYNEGIYMIGGNSYALREDGQLKAYMYPNKHIVKEIISTVDKTFPLIKKPKWGKTELLKGQLGKVTIKEPTSLWKPLDNGSLEKVRDLKVGEEYRVYRYIEENGGLYGVGSGMYVQKDTSKVLYETPSKKNLRLLKIMNGE